MKENYSINEILNAIDEIQNFKNKKNSDIIQIKKNVEIKSDIPSNTWQLIEEAEKTIKLKLQSE